MEELNAELKAEVNGHLEYLLKKIGNNRQQLSAKVIGFYRDINKELNKDKVTPERREAIMREVSSIEKMAANQLPHYEPYSEQEARSQKPEARRQETGDRRQETEFIRKSEVSGQAVEVKVEKAPVKKEPVVKAKPAPAKPVAAKSAPVAKAKAVAKPAAKAKPAKKTAKPAKAAKKKK